MTLEHAGGDLVAELSGAAPAEDRATVIGRARQRRLWSCTEKLLLKVNEAKSAVARPEERKFLGFSISNDGSERRIASKALDKFKALIRDMTRRTLWLLPDPTGAYELGSVDPPKTTLVSLAAMGERAQPLQGTAPSWRTKAPCRGCRRFADGILAHVRTPCGPTGPAKPLLRVARSPPSLCLCPSLIRSNRRGT